MYEFLYVLVWISWVTVNRFVHGNTVYLLTRQHITFSSTQLLKQPPTRYGDEYPYTKNPFALSLPLSECPKDTYVKLSCSHDQKQDGDRPLSAWRKIEIMKTEAKNNKAREAFEASVYEWHARLQQCPRWWPNQNISTEKGSDIRRALVVIFG